MTTEEQNLNVEQKEPVAVGASVGAGCCGCQPDERTRRHHSRLKRRTLRARGASLAMPRPPRPDGAPRRRASPTR
jgi:hypothetical protein